MDDDEFYYVIAVDGRGNIREDNGDGTRETAYRIQNEWQKKHPNWTVRVRVIGLEAPYCEKCGEKHYWRKRPFRGVSDVERA